MHTRRYSVRAGNHGTVRHSAVLGKLVLRLNPAVAPTCPCMCSVRVTGINLMSQHSAPHYQLEPPSAWMRCAGRYHQIAWLAAWKTSRRLQTTDVRFLLQKSCCEYSVQDRKYSVRNLTLCRWEERNPSHEVPGSSHPYLYKYCACAVRCRDTNVNPYGLQTPIHGTVQSAVQV